MVKTDTRDTGTKVGNSQATEQREFEYSPTKNAAPSVIVRLYKLSRL